MSSYNIPPIVSSSAVVFKPATKMNSNSQAIKDLKERNDVLSDRLLKLEREFKAFKESMSTPVSGEKKKKLLGRDASQSVRD